MTPRHLADAALIALIDGSSDSLRSSTIHLQECLACRRRRDELIVQSDALGRLFAAEDEALASVQPPFRALSVERATRSTRGRRPGPTEPGRKLMAAAAAALLLAVVLPPLAAAIMNRVLPSEPPLTAPQVDERIGVTSYLFEASRSELSIHLEDFQGHVAIQRAPGEAIRVSVLGGDGSEVVSYGRAELELRNGVEGTRFVVTVPQGTRLRVFDAGTEVDASTLGEAH